MIRFFHRGQDGFFLIEVLVVVFMFALLGLGFVYSSIFGMKMRLRAVHNSVAMQLANEQLESFLSVDPSTLDSADNFSDTVTRDNMSFQRYVTFTVNGDNSRTVQIRVNDANTEIAAQAVVSETIALWGTQ